MEAQAVIKVPRAFVFRRVHSLLGLWVVIYLIEHLVTNSQAALFIGNDGRPFIQLVNVIHGIPFLKAVEILLIGVPILFHGVWGVKYALTAKSTIYPSDGSYPSLRYERNLAFYLQRLSSWILLLGIIGHVVQMRYINYPHEIQRGDQRIYLVSVKSDPGLFTLAERLGITLYSCEEIQAMRAPYSQGGVDLIEAQKQSLEQNWIRSLQSVSLHSDEMVAACPNIGEAFLLRVRDTFKSPFMMFLYAIFVMAAVFHAFNGTWTFMMTWGVILSVQSQARALKVCYGFMALFLFLSLFTVVGTYWINLRS